MAILFDRWPIYTHFLILTPIFKVKKPEYEYISAKWPKNKNKCIYFLTLKLFRSKVPSEFGFYAI